MNVGQSQDTLVDLQVPGRSSYMVLRFQVLTHHQMFVLNSGQSKPQKDTRRNQLETNSRVAAWPRWSFGHVWPNLVFSFPLFCCALGQAQITPVPYIEEMTPLTERCSSKKQRHAGLYRRALRRNTRGGSLRVNPGKRPTEGLRTFASLDMAWSKVPRRGDWRSDEGGRQVRSADEGGCVAYSLKSSNFPI